MQEEIIPRADKTEVHQPTLGSVLSEGAKRLYFIGIGGIAMSATAGIARRQGLEVFGTDKSELYAPAKDVLDSEEIPYVVPYNQQNIVDHPADIYIVSAGEGMENPEVAYLHNNGVPLYSFSELLYELSEDLIRVVIAGTHGKSTTTGFIGHALEILDDSSFMAGAVLQDYNTNFHSGGGHYFVFEGDEYKATFEDTTPKFHLYKADILVLTNLEYDHPDVFQSFEDMQEEFAHLIANVPDDGLIVYNADDAHLEKLVYRSEVAKFGFSIKVPSEFQAVDIHYGPKTVIKVLERAHNQEAVQQYELQLPGEINVYNGLATIAMLRALNFSPELIAGPISSYSGVKRRFELLGAVRGITVIDDYAHHPTAVRETIEAAKTRYPDQRIWAIFEPHTFSRTEATLDELATSFNSADQVLISDIYPARESVKDATITSDQVIAAVKQNQANVRLVHNKQEALQLLKTELKSGDIVVVMAVGSFNRLGYELLEAFYGN